MAYIKFVERTLTCKYKDSSTYEDLLRYCGNPEKAVAAGVFHLESMTTAAAEMQCTAQQFHKDYGTRIQHIIEGYLNLLTSDLKKEMDEVNIIRSLKQEHIQMRAS